MIWLESDFFAAYIFGLGVGLGLMHRFRFLHLYLFCAVCVNLADILVLSRCGIASSAYLHCYYYSDLLLVLALYLAIVELYRLKLPRNVWRYSWPISLAIPVLVISLSVAAAHESATYGLFHFTLALAEYVFLATLALTFVLWGISCMTFRDGGIATRMIRAWGVYFLLAGLVYCVRQLSPPYLHYPMAVAKVYTAWLPVALGFAMLNGLEFGI